jgi:uncharacterized protein (TIGR02453 family)
MTRFRGFSDESFRFLRGLKRNNRRDWFLRNKHRYDTAVRAPMEALVYDVGERLQSFAPEFAANPKRSIYRIYRDTRFSHDKRPYKTHIAAVFPHRELGKHQGAGFYVHVAPDDVFAGGGLYRPERRDLQAIRLKLADQHETFRRIVSTRMFREMFDELSGERLERVPRGFASDHPASDLLKYKQFLAGRPLPGELATSSAFPKELVRTFRTLLPMIRFLNSAIELERNGGSRKTSLAGGSKTPAQRTRR